jgi:excisionase family DNA binding protein
MSQTASADAKRLTAQEVAKLLDLNLYTVYKWARTGRIPCIKFRRGYRFKMADIERWEAKHTLGKF